MLFMGAMLLQSTGWGMQQRRLQKIQKMKKVTDTVDTVCDKADNGMNGKRLELHNACNKIISQKEDIRVLEQLFKFFTERSKKNNENKFSSALINHCLAILHRDGNLKLNIQKDLTLYDKYLSLSVQYGYISALVERGKEHYLKNHKKEAMKYFKDAIEKYGVTEEDEQELYVDAIGRAYYYQGLYKVDTDAKEAYKFLGAAAHFDFKPAMVYFYGLIFSGTFGITRAAIEKGEALRRTLVGLKDAEAIRSFEEHEKKVKQFFIPENEGDHFAGEAFKIDNSKVNITHLHGLASHVPISDPQFNRYVMKEYYRNKYSDEMIDFMINYYRAVKKYNSCHYIFAAKHMYLLLEQNQWSKELGSLLYEIMSKKAFEKTAREKLLKGCSAAIVGQVERFIKLLNENDEFAKKTPINFLEVVAELERIAAQKWLEQKEREEQALKVVQTPKKKAEIVWDEEVLEEEINEGIARFKWDENCNAYNIAPDGTLSNILPSKPSKEIYLLKRRSQEKIRRLPTQNTVKKHLSQVDWYFRKDGVNNRINVPQIEKPKKALEPKQRRVAELKPKRERKNDKRKNYHEPILRSRYSLKPNPWILPINPWLERSYEAYWYNLAYWSSQNATTTNFHNAVVDLSTNEPLADEPMDIAIVKVLPLDPGIEKLIFQFLNGRVALRIVYTGEEAPQAQELLSALLVERQEVLELESYLHSLEEGLKTPLTIFNLEPAEDIVSQNPWILRINPSKVYAYSPGEEIYAEYLSPPKGSQFDSIRIEASSNTKYFEDYSEGNHDIERTTNLKRKELAIKKIAIKRKIAELKTMLNKKTEKEIILSPKKSFRARSHSISTYLVPR